MRVALVHSASAATEPEASCRFVDRLAIALADRGHQVTLVTADRHRPGGPEPRVAARRCPAPPRLPAARYHEEALGQVPAIFWHLIRLPLDVAHAFFPAAGWAAARARALGGPPVVFSLDREPDRRYLVARHYRLEMLREIAERADECTVASARAARSFERYLLRRPLTAPRALDGPPEGRVPVAWYEKIYRALPADHPPRSDNVPRPQAPGAG